MIADDQQTSRLPIRATMAELGITQIARAKDGGEALDALIESPVHLVISDYHMPKLDGVELLQAVRARGPTPTSDFVLPTTAERAEFPRLPVRMEVNHYSRRPVSVFELGGKIEAVFEALQ